MQKTEALRLVAEKISGCTKCPELCAHRLKTVPGSGHPGARLMIIGEAPGQREAEGGFPFIGPAGRLLDRALSESGLARDRVFVTNTVKCRPPQNRDPTTDEANNCRPFLDLQIEVVGPELILCLGRVAAVSLLGAGDERWEMKSISSLRHTAYDHRGIRVACTYHPSYALRNPEAYRDIVFDIKNLTTGGTFNGA